MTPEDIDTLVAQLTSAIEQPETFPRALLDAPPMIRQTYFEQECVIEHTSMLQACQQILAEICMSNAAGMYRRKGKLVLVIGPSRVGKTTLIQMLQQELIRVAQARFVANPAFLPFASVSAAGAENGRFDWRDYYTSVLASLGDPFVTGPRRGTPLRDVRNAMIEAIQQRQPLAIIVDEAHHLAKHGSGRRLQDQLDLLKQIENVTGVSHILVGTYEMQPFRKINPQLACRSVDVHFRRYDLADDDHAVAFISTLWAFQRLLPLPEEPPLCQRYWRLLYAACVGCVGMLKEHLDRALARALMDNAATLSHELLQATAKEAGKVKLAWRAIQEGEADLRQEAAEAEEIWQELGLSDHPSYSATKDVPTKDEVIPPPSSNTPFQRAPGRDVIGMRMSNAAPASAPKGG